MNSRQIAAQKGLLEAAASALLDRADYYKETAKQFVNQGDEENAKVWLSKTEELVLAIGVVMKTVKEWQ